MSDVFRIVYGDYDLAIDRGTLRYSLVETKTGTVWADDLSLGFIAFEDRDNGELSRYDFGQAVLVSLSEKAGAQGKEVLFGLDCVGVPIDLYFTCTEREIQLTVEANRDSATHRVRDVCLLPGLCCVPNNDTAFLVVPNLEGALLRARDVAALENSAPLRFWDPNGLSMPFWGAVRGAGDRRSALGLITDSAYGALHVARTSDGGASLDPHFERDPERRRLDIRLLTLPGEDHVGIARAYREKIVGERQHVLLRRKVRERPPVDMLLGGANLQFPSFADAAPVARDLKENGGVERALCVFRGFSVDTARGFVGADDENGMRQAVRDIQALGFLAGAALHGEIDLDAARRDLPEVKRRYNLDALFLDTTTAAPLQGEPGPGHGRSRWDDLDRRMDLIALVHEHFPVFGGDVGMDWSALACDYWEGILADPYEPDNPFAAVCVPLYAAVYHDAVVAYPQHHAALDRNKPKRFLRSLRALCPPCYVLDKSYFDSGVREYVRRTCAVLAPLHRLCFPAFLTAHRFLTPDFAVEEARYSNGARVLVNSGDALYENDEIVLPPRGFWAEHEQFVAHDALRVGQETFPQRAWRIVRARDDKPIARSSDVERREFPVT